MVEDGDILENKEIALGLNLIFGTRGKLYIETVVW